jgi:hypothetical protein
MPDLSQIGRLALRVEGSWWVAYYAMPNTMAGSITLGRIRMRFVADPRRKDAFIALMREAVGDVIEERIGVRPQWPNPPQVAPEHERSGSA